MRGGVPADALTSLGSALGRMRSLSEASRLCLSTVASVQGWAVGEAWLLGPDGEAIVPEVHWTEDAELEPFVVHPSGRPGRPMKGVIRTVWESTRPLWIEDLRNTATLDDGTRLLRRQAALDVGLRSVLAVPVVAGGASLAVLMWLAREPRRADRRAQERAQAAVTPLAYLVERRHQRRRIEEADARYRLIATEARDMVATHAPDGRFTWVSPSAAALLGVAPDRLVGTDAYELIHPDDVAVVRSSHAALQHGDDDRTIRCRLRRADGRYVWVESVARSLRAPDGALRALHTVTRDIGERVEAERARSAALERERRVLEGRTRSEARLRALFEASPIAIVVTDAQTGRYVLANRRFEELTGYHREELIGRTAEQLGFWVGSDSRGAFLEALTEQPRLTEYPSVLRDRHGRERSLVVSATSFDLNGRRAVLAMLLDVSEQRRLEVEASRLRSAVARNEQRFRALIEKAHDAVTLVDAELRVTYRSANLYEAVGYQPEEMPRRADALVHPDDAEPFRALLDRLRAAPGASDRMRYRLRHGDGTYHWMEANLTNLLDEPAVEAFVFNWRDVSEEVRADEARAERSRQLAALAEAATSLHAVDRLPELMRTVTERARTILGAHQALLALVPPGPWGREAARGHGSGGPVQRAAVAPAAEGRGQPSEIPRFVASLSERYAEYRDYDTPPRGSGIYRLVVEHRRPFRMTQEELEAHPLWTGFGDEAGRHPPMRGWLAAPILSSGGTCLAVLQLSDRHEGEFTADDEAMLVQLARLAGVAMDKLVLLEEVRAQAEALERRVSDRTAELRVVNDELTAFNYSVSHDLRAPLRAIDGFGRALEEDYGDRLDDRGRHYLERVRVATHRMGRLIDDLLTLSRVGRADLDAREVDLAALAREVVAGLREAEPDRSVEVAVDDPLPAHGDPRLLRVALENLIGNAWKFTSHNAVAHIAVGSEERDGGRVYTVRDDGVGFDPAYRERVFDVFQRLHPSEAFPGTGVGLATVQRIVRRHGGRVWVDSREGEGAAFHFTLSEGER